MCEVFPTLKDEQWSLVVTMQSKVAIWEKSFNWAYSCANGPKVEVYTYTQNGSVLYWLIVTFKSCGLSLLSMEMLSNVNRQVAVLVVSYLVCCKRRWSVRTSLYLMVVAYNYRTAQNFDGGKY